jgi:hypothetical protein
LAHTEVDDPWNGFSVDLGYEDIGWFEIAMEDRLLMCMLHSLAHLYEELHALPHGQLVPVAVEGDRQAGHVLHGEVRPPFGGGPGIEDLGDGGVIHEGQRLAFRLETRHHLARVHTGFDQLKGYAAADRLPLLGHPNLAHTAFAYQLQQVIRADDALGEEAVRSRSSGGTACGRCGIRIAVGRFRPHDGDTFRIRSARQEKDPWSVLIKPEPFSRRERRGAAARPHELFRRR